MNLMNFGWSIMIWGGAIFLALLGYLILKLWRKKMDHRDQEQHEGYLKYPHAYPHAKDGALLVGGLASYHDADNPHQGVGGGGDAAGYYSGGGYAGGGGCGGGFGGCGGGSCGGGGC